MSKSGYTKENHREYMRAWRVRNLAKCRKIRKKYECSHPGKKTDQNRRYRKAHPLKAAAQRAVSTAVTSKRLIRSLFCQLCLGDLPVQAHHSDYSQPLDVVWLCTMCHMGIEHKTLEFRNERRKREAEA